MGAGLGESGAAGVACIVDGCCRPFRGGSWIFWGVADVVGDCGDEILWKVEKVGAVHGG